MAKKKSPLLRITLFKSAIGYSKRQKRTLVALGLKRLGQTVEHKDNECLRGMLNRVSHLIHVEEI